MTPGDAAMGTPSAGDIPGGRCPVGAMLHGVLAASPPRGQPGLCMCLWDGGGEKEGGEKEGGFLVPGPLPTPGLGTNSPSAAPRSRGCSQQPLRSRSTARPRLLIRGEHVRPRRPAVPRWGLPAAAAWQLGHGSPQSHRGGGFPPACGCVGWRCGCGRVWEGSRRQPALP